MVKGIQIWRCEERAIAIFREWFLFQSLCSVLAPGFLYFQGQKEVDSDCFYSNNW